MSSRHLKIIALILLTTLFRFSNARAEILDPDKSISGLKDAACAIDKRFPLDPGIHEGVTEVTHALEALEKKNAEAKVSDIDKDPNLSGALNDLAKRVHEKTISDYTVDPDAKSPLALALKEHLEKYKTEAARRADPNGFVNSMLKVLGETKEGQGLKECFERKDSPLIRKSTFVFKSPEESAGETGAVTCAFGVQRNDPAGTTFDKVVTLDVSTNPSVLITFFGHELHHSCNTPQFLNYQLRALDIEKRAKIATENYEKLRIQIYKVKPVVNTADGAPDVPLPADPNLPMDAPPDLLTLKKAAEKDSEGHAIPKAKLNQLEALSAKEQTIQKEINSLVAHMNVDYSIDELKAYRFTYKVFKELAVNAPKTLCNNYSVTGLFYKKVISTGDYMAALQEDDHSGRFAHTLIDDYSGDFGYAPESFYIADPATFEFKKDPETGLPLIKPAVKAKMKAAGFDVNP